jgi:hypothetical protein
MIVSGSIPVTGPNTPKKEAEVSRAAEKPAYAQALVPVEPTERTSVLRPARPEASFVVHLIATAEHAPQTRTLRRTSPAAAQAIYGRAAATGLNSYGKVLSQTA